MAYIVVVNPQILSAGGKSGMTFTGVLTATVLICFTMTLLMGVYANGLTTSSAVITLWL